MVFPRQGNTDIRTFRPFLTRMAVAGLSGGLGFDWTLAVQVTGWIVSGIGVGLSVKDAIWGAKQQSGVESLEPAEISAVAAAVAAADPQKRSVSTWEQLLGQQFGAGAVTPQIPTCPQGFYPTPEGGCLPIQRQAGLGLGAIPTWAWIGIAFLGFMAFKGKIL